jgi:toxin-antitoxin system PIN domain toxin
LIAPDVNLLLYAYNDQSPFHLAAKEYWKRTLSETQAVGVPVLSVHGFLRLSTNPVFGSGALSMADALAAVNGWLARPHVSILYPGSDHWRLVQELLRDSGGSRMVTDAAVAAIALEHDATIHSVDSDFARFAGVRWHNPLQG